MKRYKTILTLSIFCALAMFAERAKAQTDTTFTYQGRLNQNGQPVNGIVDLDFALFDAEVGGSQIDAEIMFNSVPIIDGLFTVDLDFGAAAFDNSNRWLRIKVNGTTLNPRQPVSRSPYAIQTRGLFVDEMQNVGIGTNLPVNALHVAADTPALRLENNIDPASPLVLENSGTAQMRLNKFTSTGTSLIDINPMPLDGTGTANIRCFRLTNTTGIKSVIFHSGNNSTATSAVIGVGGNTSVFQLDGGNFGIGIPTPGSKLHVGGGAITVSNQGDQADAMVLGIERSWAFRQQGSGSGTALKLQSIGGGGNKNFLIDTAGFVGIGTLDPQAKLDVNGTARVQVLEITGADLAEKFAASETLEPGTVCAIDREHAGKLCISRGAYNRCVAGVVSGANNFSVGAVLGNLPGQEDAPAIALSGRVYVRCDAAGGAIEPGDLLTTSDTPGHAMKATDRDRSHGAVIGKAMERLEAGETGLVLVLINLQ